MPIHLCVCSSVSLSLVASVGLFLILSLSVRLRFSLLVLICLFVWPCLFDFLSCLSVCLHGLSVCLSVCLPACLPCLSVYVSVCLSVCLHLFVYVSLCERLLVSVPMGIPCSAFGCGRRLLPDIVPAFSRSRIFGTLRTSASRHVRHAE
jgi:hypothetical protein